MNVLLYLIILLPIFGFLLLSFSRGRWPEKLSAIIGVGSVGISALITFCITIYFYCHNIPNDYFYNQTLWHLIIIDNFAIPITFILDNVSLIMLGIVTGVGFLIHLYSAWYMCGEESYAKFFAYTNLFIANMIVLVLADNMMLMYLGWEGVGVCSYLLIGFYHTNSANGKAAMKAFLMTRIGDVSLAIGMFILYNQFGTLSLHELSIVVPQQISTGSALINCATLMIFGGVVSKSAQLPLHTWLSDAMAGPTPVSALIHSSTMVNAGVYLIARTHILFLLAPDILYLVSIIGVSTLLLAGCAALVQTDIKRVLAYSTMSQIGYMFLALGVQAWDAAIFHLITHAFFKSLLFLSAGSVIIACHQEQNIFKMGGLLKSLPFVYGCFLIGGSSLAAIPLITAGFYSKDEILWWTAFQGHNILLFASIIGSFITTIYTFRMIFIVFHGTQQIRVVQPVGIAHNLPLFVLAVLSTFLGVLIVQPQVQDLFSTNMIMNNYGKSKLDIISSVVILLGLTLTMILYLGKRQVVKSISTSTAGRFLTNLCYQGWGFDQIYHFIFIKTFKIIAQLLKNDPFNSIMNILVAISIWMNKILAFSQNGKIRFYLFFMTAGAVLMMLALLFMV
ncbi:NADH-quinone oxidoreductase subunit L [Arsenophonus sp.]|uniref:NADH-quinone oxidoreductase subunit L n=1 Tax=Arsenophonus sp. TaxID=1872640 RepID=UPI002864C1CE|nr:NADH-quinone oxidoreductase subunit L [Arsenophonus sp.]MDR5617827.1 NADH-quinone oxidoreductase subunit L [Arsenophonus sp.]